MVQAGDEVGELLERHADELGELFRRVVRRHADADDLLVRRSLVDGPAERGHRVRVVEQPGVRADLRHVSAQREERRDRAERAEDASEPERVAHGLLHAVARRDVEVELQARVTAHADHADHVVGALERGPPVGVRLDRRLRTQRVGRPSGHGGGGVQAIGVDVVERDRATRELLEPEDVGDQFLRERHAAGSVEHDLGHRCASCIAR